MSKFVTQLGLGLHWHAFRIPPARNLECIGYVLENFHLFFRKREVLGILLDSSGCGCARGGNDGRHSLAAV
ncbi:hypothetical protein LB503_000754 [Fusarium chuoi]|nr:hypothetical protein LB503_000754 [Fusarium chuoi]